MKNVGSLIKEYKLSSSEIINFLIGIGVKNASLNTRINSSLEQQILNHFFKTKSNKVLSKPDFYIESPELITVFSDNIFTNVIQNISHSNYNSFNSYFTDEQAKNICSKMSNKRIRHFSNIFLTVSPNIDRITLKYQIHFIVNKALEFYGGRILTFIYKLKNWTARKNNVEVLKMNTSSIYNFDPNFPKLHIQSFEQNKSFTITFTRAYERLSGSYSALRITNNSTNKSARVSVNGQLIDDFENFNPEIAIFKESLDGIFSLYSGYDDDYCDICGRRLEDPVSIKYGRGPTCRRDYGIP